jgi:hypothetical protein
MKDWNPCTCNSFVSSDQKYKIPGLKSSGSNFRTLLDDCFFGWSKIGGGVALEIEVLYGEVEYHTHRHHFFGSLIFKPDSTGPQDIMMPTYKWCSPNAVS